MGALAEIFRRHGSAYRAQFAARMPSDQLRAMRAIERCRTAALGGQRWRCPQCGQERGAYHSCGNRHCPACGNDDAREWLRRQEALLLPAGYHLCTFTVPKELRAAIRSHPREGLAILFAASSSTLLDACANPKWFGARPGVTGVLHTNTRALIYHPHVHYVVTGGGLAPDGTWRKAGAGFLVPVRGLSALFRARFRDALRQRLPEVFATIPPSVWRRDWVVHSKAVGDGKNVLRYLSRYLYRVALADSAILAHDAQTVAFHYRDSATHKTRKTGPAGHGIHPPLPPARVALRFRESAPLWTASSLASRRAFSRPRNAVPASGRSRARSSRRLRPPSSAYARGVPRP